MSSTVAPRASKGDSPYQRTLPNQWVLRDFRVLNSGFYGFKI
jgi:hypothetical protein